MKIIIFKLFIILNFINLNINIEDNIFFRLEIIKKNLLLCFISMRLEKFYLKNKNFKLIYYFYLINIYY